MDHVINYDLGLLVPHGIESPDRPTQLTGKILSDVGQYLGLVRVGIVALRGHQSEHRPKRGTIVEITHSKNRMHRVGFRVNVKEC
jgi:hypothetical protein